MNSVTTLMTSHVNSVDRSNKMDGSHRTDHQLRHPTLNSATALLQVLNTINGDAVPTDLSRIVRCAFFTMDPAVLGLGSGAARCTERVFRQKGTPKDTIGTH
jgi:hypothetical protein